MKENAGGFKPGDKVVSLVNGDVTKCLPRKGTEGVVLEYPEWASRGNVFVQWEPGTTGGNGAWFCMPEEIELKKFKPGTIVEFIDEKMHEIHPEWYPKKGTLGEILGGMVGRGVYKVRWAMGSTSYDDHPWVSTARIREAKVVLKKKSTPKLEGFKKGDIVRQTNSEDNKRCPSFYPKKGKIGVVLEDCEYGKSVYIQWEAGSTSDDGCWVTGGDSVAKVKFERRS